MENKFGTQRSANKCFRLDLSACVSLFLSLQEKFIISRSIFKM